MKSRRMLRPGCNLLIAGFIILSSLAVNASPTKAIRLRNGFIATPPAAQATVQAHALATQTPVSGLYLIQFEKHLQPAERKQLQALGVRLVQYVPDDAFIAKLDNVVPDAIRAMSFVRWVGPYQVTYKVQSRLVTEANSALSKNQNVVTNISVLVSSSAKATELAGVKALFVSIQHESDLHIGTILRGQLPLADLSALAQSSSVLWIESAPKRKLVDEAASKIVGGDDSQVATPTVTQQAGFDGKGVTVCVADTGLDTGDTNTMHPDLFGRVKGFQFYGDLTDGSDGYGHGTHCAGIVAGNAATGETDPDTGQLYGLGVASGADLFIERIFNDDAGEANPFPSDDMLTADAVRAGAKIGANSWGNDVQGAYDIDSAAFDELVRDADPGTPGDQPYILEFSAGNAGPASETIGSPASAKNVIATGASENSPGTLAETYGLYADGADTMADFSSRGPCQDGRIKPDLVAPGTWIASLASSYAPDEASIAWTAIDDYYVYMGGTSMSGPAAAGAAAVFVQYYKNFHTNAIPSPALVKAALINSADPLDDANGGPGPVPNNDEGWGRVTLTNIIVTNFDSAPRYYQYLDQTVLLQDGQVYEQHALVRDSDQPLKITLAYTDVPGFPGAIPALVNDLDLEVVGPDGTLYRGNQFSGSDSVPNAPSPDTLNNVEGVYLSHPAPGDYLVRVRASNVAEDARLDTAAIDQDFALVVSGNLSRPNGGIILLNRTNYTAPGVINMKVFDAARAASNSISVLVKSSTESAGETFTLSAAGNYGVFTGAVTTVVGTAVADQKLEIHNGDAIEADYTDSSGNPRSVTATADLISPMISNVTVTSDLGVIIVNWQTSEPADSIVRYGTNSANLNLAITNAALVTSHSVKLSGLIPGKTYYFSVSSSDPAGNAVADNNAGSYYSFVAIGSPTVLMVDDYDTAGEETAGATVISDGVYTNALTAAGFSYGFWKVTERGSPTLNDLLPYKIVIWRTTDDMIYYGVDEDGLPDPSATNNTLNAQQQSVIQDYLNSGGAFFMASMNILENVGDVPFRKNVLHVDGFVQNPGLDPSCSGCDEDHGVPEFFGASNNPITSGMYVALDYANYPSFLLDQDFSIGPDVSDTFTPGTNTTTICFESASGKPCGVCYPKIGSDSSGRVVFLSFPLDAVPMNGISPNNEVTLLRNILNFLAPGANGVGTVMLDKATYTQPAQVTVQVGDSDLTGAGHAQVTFSSRSSATPVTVTLNETTHRGLFQGYLTLADVNGTNQLGVINGDPIMATYFDVSRGSNVIATATVDTVPPVISDVSATAEIGSAVVSWTTTKPADALVQYGEGTISSYTAYAAKLTTNHVLTLSSLRANRQYYFQVTSRDAAGNTVMDDNAGALYTFTTLPAARPPWFDNLEGDVTGWTVAANTDLGSDLNWTLGPPNNGMQTSAYSGANAWGSDLNGQDISFLADTYLVSPEIDLSGLSQATLTFWDSFDFTEAPLEEGQVLIRTNSDDAFTSLPLLADYSGDAAPDWRKETIDLTPYVGQTVQIVWEYAGYFSGDQYYGWLVDDVGITGLTASGTGTITISKNLGQGTFNLTGPTSRSGNAITTTITNVPPGDYTVKFNDVTFYQTPASQTNTLTAGGTVNFTGNYTFIDANHNGISDAWENYYFGAAVTNRTQLTDTDGDGMTDCAEFIAGTNPTNAASKFIFLSAAVQTNRLVQLKWAAIPGRLYQMESSTNMSNWTPVSDWRQATSSPMTYSGTNAASTAQFFRVQVRP